MKRNFEKMFFIAATIACLIPSIWMLLIKEYTIAIIGFTISARIGFMNLVINKNNRTARIALTVITVIITFGTIIISNNLAGD